MKKLFFHSWKKYLICFIYSILIYVIYCSLRGTWNHIYCFIDSAFITGFSLICIGGLSTVNYFGAFDFWSYSFSKRGSNGKRMPIYEYAEQKRLKRSKDKLAFGPYYATGLFYVLISLILVIAMNLM